ncbi:MAG: hypothetical protein ACOZNI_31700 [Myxococcota bacterium]
MEAPPPEPPKPPRPPQQAWRDGLAPLGPMDRTRVSEHAAFVSFTEGVLTLGVRQEHHLPRIREALREADFGAALPGFRNVVVSLTEEGRTGKEARVQFEEKRMREAREAADRSEAVKRVIGAFAATLESVEPAAGGVTGPVEEEVADE